MDQFEKPDRAEPILPIEENESMEATDAAEPMDKIDPAEPMDRIDPDEPMDKMEPVEPMDRIEPDEPMDRMEPSAPASLLWAMRPLCRAGGRGYVRVSGWLTLPARPVAGRDRAPSLGSTQGRVSWPQGPFGEKGTCR